MESFELNLFAHTPVGSVAELPKAGTPLEHPLIYDHAARCLHELADTGKLEIVRETTRPAFGQQLISEFVFRRLS